MTVGSGQTLGRRKLCYCRASEVERGLRSGCTPKAQWAYSSMEGCRSLVPSFSSDSVVTASSVPLMVHGPIYMSRGVQLESLSAQSHPVTVGTEQSRALDRFHGHCFHPEHELCYEPSRCGS